MGGRVGVGPALGTGSWAGTGSGVGSRLLGCGSWGFTAPPRFSTKQSHHIITFLHVEACKKGLNPAPETLHDLG